LQRNSHFLPLPIITDGQVCVAGVFISPDIRTLARQYTAKALETLVSIMLDRESGASARTSAASILLDRAWGKPSQQVDANIDGSVTVCVVTGMPRSDRQ
jgi:hypothetical protein